MTEIALLAKATIVLVAALSATCLLRRARASVRALLLATTFGLLLMMPVAAFLMPQRTLEVPVAYLDDAPVAFEPIPALVMTGAAASQPSPSRLIWPPMATTVRGIWALVASIFLVRLGMALWHLRRIRRTAVRWSERGPIHGTLDTLRVDLFLHEDLTAPITFGVARPAIGFPIDAPEWNGPALRDALTHELEHVRRCDWPVHLMTRVACAVYWFHPLVWMAARRLCLEAERACDDAVLATGERTTYAEQLVALARRYPSPGTMAVLSMAARSDLATRVRAILDVGQARGRAGIVLTLAVLAVASALGVTLSPLQAAGAKARQQPDEGRKTFDVVSIGRNTSPTPGQTIRQQGNTFVATNVTAKDLIATAYAIESPDQVSGGPGWMTSERYDVEAKPRMPATWPEQRAMLQSMLEDRFGLVLQHESRPAPVYLLTRSATSRLKSAADCPPPSGDCSGFNTRPGEVLGRRVSMARVAAILSGARSGRRVIDNTGLEGVFDIELRWTPDPGQSPAGPGPVGVPQIDPSGPSLFTALDEQLGLRLVPGTGAVEHFVIERIERPTPNDAVQAPGAAGQPPRAAPPGLPLGIEAIEDSPTTGPNAPRFEVASIRRNLSGGNANGAMISATGQFRATNSSLARLIQVAYGLRPTDTIVGGPDWASRDGYDVDAKPADRANVAQSRLMLRTLLAERFNLAVRREARDTPVYALTLSRSDGRLGPQMVRPAGECVMAIPDFAQAAARGKPDAAGTVPRSQPPLGRPGRRCGMGPEGGTVKAGSTAIAGLITLVTPIVGRPVVDRTGLVGVFDFDLRYAGASARFSAAALAGGRGAALASPDTAPEPASDAPTIFTALQEQLGLKLEATRGLVDVLVIDRAERPTEN